ncbi:MAG: helix-turn-helix domain-containing protein [Novosphingobium sp.]
MRITLIESACPSLAPFVIGYLGGEIDESEGLQRRVIPARPNCFIQIILDGDLALCDIVDGNRTESPVAGLFGLLSQHRFDMEISGRMRSFSARLQPAAAGLLFAIDPVALVDRFVPIDLPAGLLDELRAAPDWQAMVAPMDRWLEGLAHGKRNDDPVGREASRLRNAFGNIPIQDLADAAGLSLRHFQRRFRKLTGLNPKHYARICRIGHAVHRKELDPNAAWTALAHEAGYADQSHFIRDFKALTGTLPREFLRGQSPILRYPKWDG